MFVITGSGPYYVPGLWIFAACAVLVSGWLLTLARRFSPQRWPPGSPPPARGMESPARHFAFQICGRCAPTPWLMLINFEPKGSKDR